MSNHGECIKQTGSNIMQKSLYTPYLGYRVTTCENPFPSFPRKFSRDKRPQNTPFPRKWEHACGPLVHSSGVGGGRASAGQLIWYLTIFKKNPKKTDSQKDPFQSLSGIVVINRQAHTCLNSGCQWRVYR